MKKLIILLAFFSHVALAQDVGVKEIINKNEGKDIVFKTTVNGTQTEVGRIKTSLGGVRSVGSVGSVENAQGALIDSDLPVASFIVGSGSATNTGGAGPVDLDDNVSTVKYDAKGFFGREDAIRTDKTSSSYLTRNDAYFDFDNTSFTAGLWVKPKIIQSGQAIFGSYVVGNSQFLVQIISDDFSLRILASTNGSAATLSATEPSDLRIGEWMHLALVYDGAAIKLYSNGKLTREHTYSTMFNPAGSARFEVGTNDTGAGLAPLEFQDIFVNKGTAFTAEQINTIYSKRFTNTQQIAAGHVLTSSSFPQPLTDRISYWDMNSLTDLSGNGHDLLAAGAGPATIGDDYGIFGNQDATFFDGVDDGVHGAADPFFEFTDTFTIGGWYRMDDDGGAGDRIFFSKFSSVGNQRSILVRTQADSLVDVFLYDDGITSNVTNLSQVNIGLRAGKWVHFVVRLSNGITTVFADGVPVASSSGSATVLHNSTENFYFGRTGGSSAWDGAMTQLFASRVALTDSEIKKLYSSKLTHNKNITPIDQHWQATWQSEFTNPFTLPLENGWITNMEQNDLYTDFSTLDSGHKVLIK